MTNTDPVEHTVPADVTPHMVVEPLFDRMVATQEHLNALITQIRRAVAGAVKDGRVEAAVFDPLLRQYRKASHEAAIAYEVWQRAGFPGLVLATEPLGAPPAPAPDAPPAVSSRLQFAKWLYDQGRISS